MRAKIIPINGNHLSIKHAQKSPIGCKSSEDNAVLQFGVRVLKTYKNGQETGIRRAILVRRKDGLIAEQATTFVNRELNSLALNTQITVLWDLAFIETWLQLEALTTPSFRHPAALLAKGKIPMRAGDIIKFHNWSQYIAKSLSIAVNRCKLGVAPIPNGKTVEIATTDRRLTVFRNYLVFQVENTIKGTMSIGDEEIIRSIAFCKEIVGLE